MNCKTREWFSDEFCLVAARHTGPTRHQLLHYTYKLVVFTAGAQDELAMVLLSAATLATS